MFEPLDSLLAMGNFLKMCSVRELRSQNSEDSRASSTWEQWSPVDASLQEAEALCLLIYLSYLDEEEEEEEDKFANFLLVADLDLPAFPRLTFARAGNAPFFKMSAVAVAILIGNDIDQSYVSMLIVW